MTPNILVTGASGNLGSRVLEGLSQRNIACAGTSRHAPPPGLPLDWHIVDLWTGDGLAEAAAGRPGIIHCATNQSDPEQDLVALHRLIDLARALSLHITFISVAGIENAAPFMTYYQVKLKCEAALKASGVAHLIVRATQFHEFAELILKTLSIGPVQLMANASLQPLDVAFAAQMVIGAALDRRTAPLTVAGPQILTMREMAQMRQKSQRRPLLQIPVPSLGPLRALAALHEVSGTSGGQTWADWCESRYRGS